MIPFSLYRLRPFLCLFVFYAHLLYAWSPSWQGDTAHFDFFTPDSFALNAPSETATSAIFCASSALLNAVWELDLTLRFNPSDNNYVHFYLSVSDTLLVDGFTGYYLLVGGSGDQVSLMRQDYHNTLMLIEGRPQLLNHSHNDLSIRVTRDISGRWKLLTDTTRTRTFYTEGEIVDNQWLGGAYMGISCRYTPSRSDRFSFANFYVAGVPYVDCIPPAIDTLYPVSDNRLMLVFNEAIDTQAYHRTASYTTINGHEILNHSWINPHSLLIQASYPFKRGFQVVQIDSLYDLAGNSLSDSLSFFYYLAEPLDLVINELMSDPSPYVDLPAYEYVELYNRTPYTLQMAGWTLAVGDRVYTFPDYNFAPESYLLLTYTKADSLFQSADKPIQVLPFFTSVFALPNDGTSLVLSAPDEQWVHAMSYAPENHIPAIKQQGGWSLELMDYNHACQADAWQSSVSKRGGTPGWENSISQTMQDEIPPEVEKLLVVDSHHVRVYFSETLLMNPLQNTDNCLLSSSGSLMTIDSVVAGYPLPDALNLYLSPGMEKGQIYTLHISPSSSLTDCAGHAVRPGDFRFALTEQVLNRDVVVNEVLFYPYPDGASYVELYNRSDRIFNLSDLYLAKKNEAFQLSSAYPASEEGRLFFPGDYMLITSDKDAVTSDYPCHDIKQIEEVSKMISLPNKAGSVVLTDRAYTVIDEMFYDESWHAPLVQNPQGVALEKMHPDLPSEKPESWHSASQTVGFGTPGQENSQFAPLQEKSQMVYLSPEMFTPNQDGIDDYLKIHYELNKSGYLLHCMVYDQQGRLVRNLCNNCLLGRQGYLSWNGTTDTGQLASTGIYIIYIHLYHPDGEQIQEKRTCVLHIL